uniref:Uncharacterized protein n=1 Tax=Moniliophthora roreri TaxID=221103 RepID=A0A0W0GED2_MONRR
MRPLGSPCLKALIFMVSLYPILEFHLDVKFGVERFKY